MVKESGCTRFLNTFRRLVYGEHPRFSEGLSDQDIDRILSTPGVAEQRYEELKELTKFTGLGKNVNLVGIRDKIMFRNIQYEVDIESVRDTANKIDLGSKTDYLRAVNPLITTIPNRTITIGNTKDISFSETRIYPSGVTDIATPTYLYEITLGRIKFSYFQTKTHVIENLNLDQKRTVVRTLELKLP